MGLMVTTTEVDEGDYLEVQQGEVARTVEVIHYGVIVDLDSGGSILGVESIGSTLTMSDMAAVLRECRWVG